MNKNWNLELFRILSEASQVTNEEMEAAYGYFVEHMKAISQSEDNYIEIFRTLNRTRIELAFIESLYRCEQKKKCA